MFEFHHILIEGLYLRPQRARPQSPRADPTTPEGAMILIEDALEYLQLDGNDQTENGSTPQILNAHDTPPNSLSSSDSILDLLDAANSPNRNENSQEPPPPNGGYTSVFDF